MTEDRVREIILRDTMQQREQLSHFMGDVKKLNETILERIEKQDERSAQRHEQAEERWKLTETFIKEMMPARDGLMTVQSIMRFFKWIGIPTTLVIATGYWILRKLFP